MGGGPGQWEALQRAKEVFPLGHGCPLTCKAEVCPPSIGPGHRMGPTCPGIPLGARHLGVAQARGRSPVKCYLS